MTCLTLVFPLNILIYNILMLLEKFLKNIMRPEMSGERLSRNKWVYFIINAQHKLWCDCPKGDRVWVDLLL